MCRTSMPCACVALTAASQPRRTTRSSQTAPSRWLVHRQVELVVALAPPFVLFDTLAGTQFCSAGWACSAPPQAPLTFQVALPTVTLPPDVALGAPGDEALACVRRKSGRSSDEAAAESAWFCRS